MVTRYQAMAVRRRIPPITTSSIPVETGTWLPRRRPMAARATQMLAVQRGIPQLYGYPLGLGADGPGDLCPTSSMTDAELRRCGLNPHAVRGLEREFAQMGMGVGLGGIFGTIWKGIKGAAKGVAKGVSTVAKVARPLVKFVPGVGPVADTAFDFVGSVTGGGGQSTQPFIPTQTGATVVPGVLRLLARQRARQGDQQAAQQMQDRAERVERIIEQTAPPPPVIVQTPSGPAPAQAAGMPGWMPLALLAVAGLALMKGKR